MNDLRCRLIALALAVVCFAGCSSALTLTTGMAVNVAAFQPAAPGKPEDGGTITLRYVNETVASLGFSRSEHKLYLNGTLAATLVNDTPFGIVTVSEITRDVPVHFDHPSFIRQLVDSGATVVRYRLVSQLDQRIGDERNNMKLTSEGSLDLRGSPVQPAKSE